MSDHTLRLKVRVLQAIEQYEKGLLSENGLDQIITGTSSATEDMEFNEKLSEVSAAIFDSLYQFDAKEGKEYLARKISSFKMSINQ